MEKASPDMFLKLTINKSADTEACSQDMVLISFLTVTDGKRQ
jgi:hypothetical protein